MPQTHAIVVRTENFLHTQEVCFIPHALPYPQMHLLQDTLNISQLSSNIVLRFTETPEMVDPWIPLAMNRIFRLSRRLDRHIDNGIVFPPGYIPNDASFIHLFYNIVGNDFSAQLSAWSLHFLVPAIENSWDFSVYSISAEQMSVAYEIVRVLIE